MCDCLHRQGANDATRVRLEDSFPEKNSGDGERQEAIVLEQAKISATEFMSVVYGLLHYAPLHLKLKPPISEKLAYVGGLLRSPHFACFRGAKADIQSSVARPYSAIQFMARSMASMEMCCSVGTGP